MTEFAIERPEGDEPIADILRDLYGVESGGSPFGWSAASLAMKCWRLAKLRNVDGMARTRKGGALDVGVLTHFVLERAYRNGSYSLDDIAKRAPETVAAVRNLLYTDNKNGYAYLPTQIVRDFERYEVLAVEHNASFKLTRLHPAKFTKPRVFSTRYDTILREKATSRVFILEHKTASALTSDYLRGYSHDGQLLSQALVWEKAGLTKRFGELAGFLVNILVKTKVPQHERIEVCVSPEEVAVFWKATKPWIVEYYERAENDASGLSQWPKNYASCLNMRYGNCDFFDYCEDPETNGRLYEIRRPTPGGRGSRGAALTTSERNPSSSSTPLSEPLIAPTVQINASRALTEVP